MEAAKKEQEPKKVSLKVRKLTKLETTTPRIKLMSNG